MRALIIDDEPPARRQLKRLLLEHPWVKIIGEAGNVERAAELIQAQTPELLFLDIQMPGGSGFDLLEQLDEIPEVIFTTAHDEYAVQAFRVDALDYLLKPIDSVRLAQSLARVMNSQATKATRAGAVLERTFVRDGNQCWFIPLKEVCLLTTIGNYVRLSWGRRQPLLCRSLTALEQRLDPNRFFRANRSQVINLDFIDRVETGINGRLHVQLREGPEVEISRRQARLFKSKLSI